MRTLIKNARIVNEGGLKVGSLLVVDDIIKAVGDVEPKGDEVVVDAEGCWLLPGVIDDHVHFRDPGLTHKADMHTESMAAAAGGVTSVLDMPNVLPLTTTLESWQERMAIAGERMHVNYAFFIGATNDNIEEIQKLPVSGYPGVKLFMGSSTGNMLVDREEALKQIFAKSPKLIMTHCEDTAIINRNMEAAKKRYGDDPDVVHHPEIRSREACYESSALAVRMARESGARLHIAHITTREELELLEIRNEKLEIGNGLTGLPQITGEVCVAHLLYTDEDYRRLGTRIKCNPAVKSADDRSALRKALTDGRITVVGTDHAPHLLSEKEGGCAKAVSGMPMVQFSLVSMLELVDEGVLPIERLVQLMCHNPAMLFGIERRGFLRPGMKADMVLVRHMEDAYEITREQILSKCGWSPRLGDRLHWKVEQTWVNGQCVYKNNAVDTTVHGEALYFS